MSQKQSWELSNLLHQAMRLQFGLAQKCLEKQGLQRAQPGIIHILEEEQDGQTQVELANKLAVTPATISAMIKRMERDGLVSRERSEEDQRVIHVYLTDAGREKAKIAKSIFGEIGDMSFKDFSAEEVAQTRFILNKLIDNIKDVSRDIKEEDKNVENI